MRASRLFAVALALGAAWPAAATEILLVWTGTTGTGTPGDSTIVVSDSQVETLTLELRADIDAVGVNGIFASIEFDRDLGDELNVLSFDELAWSNPTFTRSLAPIAPFLSNTMESSGASEGALYTFEVSTFATGPKNQTLAFGRVVFSTNPANVRNDGADVVSGDLGPDGSGAADAIFDRSEPLHVDITGSVTFGTATVDRRLIRLPALGPGGYGLLLVSFVVFGCTLLRTRR